MFSPLRNRFGIPGAISVIALVFAMLGGAYAATDNSGADKATASAKAKKGPRGPRGKTGPAGPAGPQGLPGANGKDGANGLNGLEGEKGEDGDDGATGPSGKSVVNSEFAGAEGTCTVGGSKFVVGSGTPTYACNGKQGIQGEAGEDGDTGFTATLPAGETETGAWSFGKVNKNELPEEPFAETLFVPISFPIPLSAALPNIHFEEPGTPVHYLDEGFPTGASEEEKQNCPGTAAAPDAKAGHLCIYVAAGSSRLNLETFEEGSYDITNILGAGGGFGASTTGTHLVIAIMPEEIAQGERAFARGTFAVTAP